MTEDSAPPPAKLDPESLALRALPPRAIRFRRGLIIGGAGASAAALVTVAWFALQPVSLRRVAEQSELSEPATRPDETLARAPASYGQVPRLGPPLPGDLGRPILEHQRMVAAETGGAPLGQERQAEAAERQRRIDAVREARRSDLLVPQRGAVDPQVQLQPAAEPSVAATAEARPLLNPADPNNQQRKLDFVSQTDTRGDTNPHGLAAPPSPYMLAAGSTISASLITGVRSDLPGLVTAQVTEPVYDSATGSVLLVPQGARLIGAYDSVVAFGQKRALIVWQRILLPDGSSLRLDNAPAADPSGYAGVADKVDFHSWTLLKGIVLSTLLGVGSELALQGDGDLVEAVRRASQDNATRAGDQLTQRNLNIQPTITIRPGARVRLLVNKDLVLAPWSAK